MRTFACVGTAAQRGLLQHSTGRARARAVSVSLSALLEPCITARTVPSLDRHFLALTSPQGPLQCSQLCGTQMRRIYAVGGALMLLSNLCRSSGSLTTALYIASAACATVANSIQASSSCFVLLLRCVYESMRIEQCPNAQPSRAPIVRSTASSMSPALYPSTATLDARQCQDSRVPPRCWTRRSPSVPHFVDVNHSLWRRGQSSSMAHIRRRRSARLAFPAAYMRRQYCPSPSPRR
ncbi:uncharacterized protein SCHCODRAFT_02280043 [Schizophyllum commune H4-8]|uniref:uncharacterized protein n=1 Tax=Schizophyllum commune (strain H4-8 / FGSC 9210) TaxID=578458 RepID=UPI0021605608|nr:uncharacterized protein SCHCODRAFT_02280043 [Schizophyllum commune H4-8]KAI5892003.1 hypothetical protein SCHCODRAFT_02280043 [Schizophyllum commune H4-8]